MHRTRSVVAMLAVSAGMLLTSCTSGGDTAATTTPTSTVTAASSEPEHPIGSYVAIGDSFTAGPGIPAVRDGSGFCLRSNHNWPSLLERALHAKSFIDMSCIGAVTHDLLAARAIPGAVVPAQLAAVKKDTDLVTVGIGGNDGGLFTSLLSACTEQRGACGSFAEDTAPAILDATVPHIADVLRVIRDKAPDATILLVGYLRILPESGTCETIGIPADDVSQGARVEQALDEALARAARQADVRYVSMRSVSRGHDACAGAEAWTNGGNASGDDGVAFHPRLAGMRAVARAVAAELASP
jgi:lysophospholipase L1-like esterase